MDNNLSKARDEIWPFFVWFFFSLAFAINFSLLKTLKEADSTVNIHAKIILCNKS